MVPRAQFVQLDPNQADKLWLGFCRRDPNSKSAALSCRSMSTDSQRCKLISGSTQNAGRGSIAPCSFMGRDEFVSIAKHEQNWRLDGSKLSDGEVEKVGEQSRHSLFSFVSGALPL
ncbi:hypothetical protein ACJRO7_000304 [Eucalyptus globulus]|uniref:Uncharacterized protein n=1 Tax=Eucalyptus globulus TaxID=34317 RepID=A0ABD3LN64_EUCGL